MNTNVIVGELIRGDNSRAIGQIVSATSNTVTFVYLNGSKFTVGEIVRFDESSIDTILQGVNVGN